MVRHLEKVGLLTVCVQPSNCVGPSQVDSLSERVEELKQDKKRLVEEYEAKLSKVRCLSTKPCEIKRSRAVRFIFSNPQTSSFSFCLLSELMILGVQSQCAFATTCNVTSGKVILGAKN